MQTVIFTLLALVAFAANSVLCRLALGQTSIEQGGVIQAIDATNFTVIRLLSGAIVLMLILMVRKRWVLGKTGASTNNMLEPSNLPKSSYLPEPTKGSWLGALYLFIYAVTFSFAYVTIDTGTGALVLFGAVQLAMMCLSYLSGNRYQPIEWVGIGLAFAGFVYLVAPDLTTPSLAGFVLMTCSGVAWALYTLAGKGSKDPLADTCFNFARTLPLVLLLYLLSLVLGLSVLGTGVSLFEISATGLWLAILSGAIASGLGYTLWYVALTRLHSTQAAVVQLLVPIIAAVGGVIWADESITLRLVISSLLILGGIFTVIAGKRSKTNNK